MPVVHLADRGVVKVAGEGARAFLQNLVTCDLDKIAPGSAGFGALLTPQGKVLFDFLIAEAEPGDGGGFFLDTARVLAADLSQRLAMYKLRAPVVVEDLSSVLGVGAVVGAVDFDPEDYLVYADPRLPALGARVIGERERLEQVGGDPLAYHGHRIELAVPEGGKDFVYTDVFPHEVLMDQLHGVDFHKGCYVGQEVVSRMQHRGTARTRIVPITFEGGFGAAEGVEVMAGGRPIGRTGSQHKGAGLALLRLDKYADALGQGLPVTAGGIGIIAAKPPYASFDLPGVDA